MQKIEEFFREHINSENFLELKLPVNQEEMNTLIDKFMIYLKELKKWNKSYNLTSIDNEREIIIKHFLDSLLYLCYIPQKFAYIADIGSGAGFPGMPIAIARPYLHVTLIEPSWKKCAFLKNIKRKIGIKNVDVLQGKAEEVDKTYDIITTRALWSIKDFVKRCNALLKEEGYFIVSKSWRYEEEIKELSEEYRFEIKEFILPATEVSCREHKRFIIKIGK
ncbi:MULTISPECIES: 16S rRNA (guanine(527)-N(7))-methyltransferase RsmG [Thermodesulfovibrio]|jgi:16S rRNA (guanine527-N7)-methyltransferase|uniref:16S rRNA (guanine(527)-N(7))-methyltransferase RsmG n=1 Tax=Thermodesulfovibrio TaxID=28261 RepID=UPI002638E436|nr:16S rRNA (guanine(527)-N(7))-methyltransferase RsmG [Thermodesulfovibrio sp.]